jgi:hypothetical protein
VALSLPFTPSALAVPTVYPVRVGTAELLAPDLVFTVPGGGHDWETWKKLWKQVLDHIEAKTAILKGR